VTPLAGWDEPSQGLRRLSLDTTCHVLRYLIRPSISFCMILRLLHSLSASTRATNCMGKRGFYAVAVGRIPGIYESWSECQKQTAGFSRSVFKTFPTRTEAALFVASGCDSAAATSAAGTAAGAGRDKGTGICPRYILYFDGGSRNNPGHAASAAVIVDAMSGKPVAHTRATLPYGTTSNAAEYNGLITGLLLLKGMRVPAHAVESIRGDSMLVVMQVRGNWAVRAAPLQPLVTEAQVRLRELGLAPHSILRQVPREENTLADALANRSLDLGTSESWCDPAHMPYRGAGVAGPDGAAGSMAPLEGVFAVPASASATAAAASSGSGSSAAVASPRALSSSSSVGTVRRRYQFEQNVGPAASSKPAVMSDLESAVEEFGDAGVPAIGGSDSSRQRPVRRRREEVVAAAASEAPGGADRPPLL